MSIILLLTIRYNMKQYIGVKQVKAIPMTRKEYNSVRGSVVSVNENLDDDGYLVEYSNGYVSWSPKKEFEEAYRKTDNLPFGAALEAKKLGKLVKRASWPDDGFFLSASTWRVLSWEDILADDWQIVG